MAEWHGWKRLPKIRKLLFCTIAVRARTHLNTASGKRSTSKFLEILFLFIYEMWFCMSGFPVFESIKKTNEKKSGEIENNRKQQCRKKRTTQIQYILYVCNVYMGKINRHARNFYYVIILLLLLRFCCSHLRLFFLFSCSVLSPAVSIFTFKNWRKPLILVPRLFIAIAHAPSNRS